MKKLTRIKQNMVMVNIFSFGNLKDCLMKGLIPLLHLIIALLLH